MNDMETILLSGVESETSVTEWTNLRSRIHRDFGVKIGANE